MLDRNRIDVTLAGLRRDLLRGAITALLASPSYDALTIIVGSSSLAQPEGEQRVMQLRATAYQFLGRLRDV